MVNNKIFKLNDISEQIMNIACIAIFLLLSFVKRMYGKKTLKQNKRKDKKKFSSSKIENKYKRLINYLKAPNRLPGTFVGGTRHYICDICDIYNRWTFLFININKIEKLLFVG